MADQQLTLIQESTLSGLGIKLVPLQIDGAWRSLPTGVLRPWLIKSVLKFDARAPDDDDKSQDYPRLWVRSDTGEMWWHNGYIAAQFDSGWLPVGGSVRLWHADLAAVAGDLVVFNARLWIATAADNGAGQSPAANPHYDAVVGPAIAGAHRSWVDTATTLTLADDTAPAVLGLDVDIWTIDADQMGATLAADNASVTVTAGDFSVLLVPGTETVTYTAVKLQANVTGDWSDAVDLAVWSGSAQVEHQNDEGAVAAVSVTLSLGSDVALAAMVAADTLAFRLITTPSGGDVDPAGATVSMTVSAEQGTTARLAIDNAGAVIFTDKDTAEHTIIDAGGAVVGLPTITSSINDTRRETEIRYTVGEDTYSMQTFFYQYDGAVQPSALVVIPFLSTYKAGEIPSVVVTAGCVTEKIDFRERYLSHTHISMNNQKTVAVDDPRFYVHAVGKL